MAAIEEVQRRKEDHKAREQPRQMMDADDVAEALGVSKSSSKARKYYEDWVQQYESEREAMLDGVAH